MSLVPKCPNNPGRPNAAPTSISRWGHKKACRNNGVPNLMLFSQPIDDHSCGRMKIVGALRFHVKGDGHPLGTQRLGRHSVNLLNWYNNEVSQPSCTLGLRGQRLGLGPNSGDCFPRTARRRFRFWADSVHAKSDRDRSRRPTVCEPSP